MLRHSAPPITRHASQARSAARATAIAGLLGLGVPCAVPRVAHAQQRGTGVDTVAAAVRAAVLRSSPDLDARRAALRATEARLGATGLAPAAALSAEAEGIPDGLDLRRAQSVRVQAERAFVSGARRSAARALATADIDAAAAALRLAEQRVAAAADRELVALVGWRSIGRRLTDEDSLLASAEGSLRTRFAVGEARYVDVLRLRTERLRVQTDRAGAIAGAQVAARGLEALVADSAAGAEVRALAETAAAAGIERSTFAALRPAPSVDSLLAVSGAARLAEVGVARATAAQRLVLADRRPRLSGFAGVQRFSGQGGYPIGAVLGASVSLPFTARRANAALAGAAGQDVVAAAAGRRATLVTLRATLRAAHDRYEAARARIAVYDAALLRGAREEREGALATYRAGDLSLVELLDFERALARAEVERIRNRIEAADALADLLAAGAHEPDAALASATSSSGFDDR